MPPILPNSHQKGPDGEFCLLHPQVFPACSSDFSPFFPWTSFKCLQNKEVYQSNSPTFRNQFYLLVTSLNSMTNTSKGKHYFILWLTVLWKPQRPESEEAGHIASTFKEQIGEWRCLEAWLFLSSLASQLKVCCHPHSGWVLLHWNRKAQIKMLSFYNLLSPWCLLTATEKWQRQTGW